MQGREVFPGDCYVGQLTLKGYEQHENNGRLLRKAYVGSGFISSNYNPSKHYFRSDGKLFEMQISFYEAALLNNFVFIYIVFILV